MTQPETIWTIGHSTRSIEEFIALLKHYQIDAIADVRRFPGSRRLPHFGEDALKKSLKIQNIDYLLLTELGGRRTPDKNSVNTAWRNPSFQGYADHIDSPEFRAGMERLNHLALKRRTAIMCAELLWWRCHRSLISDVLAIDGIKVVHIQDETHLTEHPFTQPARIYREKLIYDATKGEPLNEKERSKGIQSQMDF
jgi:uncharacterized protein (DUF488 family)